MKIHGAQESQQHRAAANVYLEAFHLLQVFRKNRQLHCLQEHEGVVKSLEQLDPDRKCFRLVGEVLVERTVKEVLPAVRSNKEQMEMVHTSHSCT